MDHGIQKRGSDEAFTHAAGTIRVTETPSETMSVHHGDIESGKINDIVPEMTLCLKCRKTRQRCAVWRKTHEGEIALLWVVHACKSSQPISSDSDIQQHNHLTVRPLRHLEADMCADRPDDVQGLTCLRGKSKSSQQQF